MKLLVHALVTSGTYYCNSLFYGLQIQLSKIKRVQNTAARLICNTLRFDHISSVLFQLHWLPVHLRKNFKVLVITYKAIYESIIIIIIIIIIVVHEDMIKAAKKAICTILGNADITDGASVKRAKLYNLEDHFWSNYRSS